MSTGGVCQICETKPGEHTCENCGAFVCDRHYARNLDLCATCANRAGGAPDREDLTDLDRDDVDRDDLHT